MHEFIEPQNVTCECDLRIQYSLSDYNNGHRSEKHGVKMFILY